MLFSGIYKTEELREKNLPTTDFDLPAPGFKPGVAFIIDIYSSHVSNRDDFNLERINEGMKE